MYDIFVNGVYFDTAMCLESAMNLTNEYRNRGCVAWYRPHVD